MSALLPSRCCHFSCRHPGVASTTPDARNSRPDSAAHSAGHSTGQSTSSAVLSVGTVTAANPAGATPSTPGVGMPPVVSDMGIVAPTGTETSTDQPPPPANANATATATATATSTNPTPSIVSAPAHLATSDQKPKFSFKKKKRKDKSKKAPNTALKSMFNKGSEDTHDDEDSGTTPAPASTASVSYYAPSVRGSVSLLASL